jgi:hypothetical protein
LYAEEMEDVAVQVVGAGKPSKIAEEGPSETHAFLERVVADGEESS